MGPFPITQLDAARLRAGLAQLERRDPERAARVRAAAPQTRGARMQDFPGDAATGVLDEDEESEERFAAFADEEPCPALDPEIADLRSVRSASHHLPHLRSRGAQRRRRARRLRIELWGDRRTDRGMPGGGGPQRHGRRAARRPAGTDHRGVRFIELIEAQAPM